jgi:hypothetical protein
VRAIQLLPGGLSGDYTGIGVPRRRLALQFLYQSREYPMTSRGPQKPSELRRLAWLRARYASDEARGFLTFIHILCSAIGAVAQPAEHQNRSSKHSAGGLLKQRLRAVCVPTSGS